MNYTLLLVLNIYVLCSDPAPGLLQGYHVPRFSKPLFIKVQKQYHSIKNINSD